LNYKEIRADWGKRGFTCDIWVDPPGQVWPDFIHKKDELVMLVEGEMELSFLGKTLRPEIGEEILIPASARHTVVNIGKATNRWYYGYKKTA
jgi:quercetin dioxygenase-like cupin family protein